MNASDKELVEALTAFTVGYEFQKYPQPGLVAAQRWSIKLLERKTGKTWDEIKELINETL